MTTAESSSQPAGRLFRGDARDAPRLRASDVPTITGVRLKPFGTHATLLNISASGVLVECDRGLRLGTAVTVVFDGTFSTPMIEGLVARSTVSTVAGNGSLRYQVGISFQTRIALDVVDPFREPEPELPPAAASPAAIARPAAVNRW